MDGRVYTSTKHSTITGSQPRSIVINILTFIRLIDFTAAIVSKPIVNT